MAIAKNRIAAARQKLAALRVAREQDLKRKADQARGAQNAADAVAIGGFLNGQQVTGRAVTKSGSANANNNPGEAPEPDPTIRSNRTAVVDTSRVRRSPAEQAIEAQLKGDWARVQKQTGSDSRGFDTNTSPALALLPAGARLSRYGIEGGNFSAPAGVRFDGRALPPRLRNTRPKEYVLLRTIPVLSGRAATQKTKDGKVWQGGGVQYFHTKSIEQMLADGDIREVAPDPAAPASIAPVKPSNDNKASQRPPGRK